jgi:hypothetical protein
MSDKVLLRVNGSTFISNSWKQELVITETAVHGEIIQGLKRLKMSLPFDRIAQVNIVRGMFKADIEVVNKGGADNLIVRALSKSDAEAAKLLIEEKMNSTPTSSPSASISIADELAKLALLRKEGVLNEQEFDAQKAKILR